MIDLADLSIIGSAFFVAAASPGPATIAVATVSMSSGRKSGMVFGLGLSIGLAFWGIIAATGLGALLNTSVLALTILKLCAGAYLLWLAFISGRSAMKASDLSIEPRKKQSSFKSGLLLNLSNPKAVFAWMAVLALGLGSGSATLHVFVAVVLCSILGFLIYALYAVIFSTSHAMLLYRRIRRWIEGTVAALFTLAGFGLIRSAFLRQ